MNKIQVPSSTDLGNMVKAAEAKFAIDRERCLRGRAGLIFAENHRRQRERLQNDARRHRYSSGQVF